MLADVLAQDRLALLLRGILPLQALLLHELIREGGGVQPYYLDEDAKVGDVKSAIEVWLTSIKYQEAAHAKLPDPDSVADLRAYAENGQAAGTAWATAVQLHCNQSAPWQYIHRAFAHFAEDVLEIGRVAMLENCTCWRTALAGEPHLLEKGNRSIKEHKGNVMHGGTNEEKYVQQTHHHQTEDGLWYETKSKQRRMPLSVAAQTHIRTHAAQYYAESRPPPTSRTGKRKQAEVVKHEKDAEKRTVTEARIKEYKTAKHGAPSGAP